MSDLPATAVPLLYSDSHGAIRVRGTRVTLDAVITAFRAGARADDIAQRFPSVSLADAHQIIAHYLNHTSDIEAYLSQRQLDAAALKREVEARFEPEGIRARLQARRAAGRARC